MSEMTNYKITFWTTTSGPVSNDSVAVLADALGMEASTIRTMFGPKRRFTAIITSEQLASFYFLRRKRKVNSSRLGWDGEVYEAPPIPYDLRHFTKSSKEFKALSVRNGLLYRDGKMLDNMEADEVAREHGYAYAEQLVRRLRFEQNGENPC